MTTDKGIILHDWEVRALLNGATQLRRPVKPQPEPFLDTHSRLTWLHEHRAILGTAEELADFIRLHAPYQSGQRLWVREEYGLNNETEVGIRAIAIHYKDGQVLYIRRDLRMRRPPPETQWYPAVTMPRWASRITLEVTSTGAGRVQEMTDDESDATCFYGDLPHKLFPHLFDDSGSLSMVECFGVVWDADNPKYSWRDNPWNWVYGVRRVE